jgi:hypothetical protein
LSPPTIPSFLFLLLPSLLPRGIGEERGRGEKKGGGIEGEGTGGVVPSPV